MTQARVELARAAVEDLERLIAVLSLPADTIYQTMRSDPSLIEPALHLFSASRHVERIADHATNIAEDVIYLVEGEIARHKHEEIFST